MGQNQLVSLLRDKALKLITQVKKLKKVNLATSARGFPAVTNNLMDPGPFSTLKMQRLVCMDSGHLIFIGLCGAVAAGMIKMLGRASVMVRFCVFFTSYTIHKEN